ncbi:MAG: phosphoribosylformylglycinamidine synthase subunit PurL [Nitrospirae bacterium]|nr:phosphoribosylformylglycinamidine synthase subunit PurL [Nitrospirota bacterium]MCL5285065.1 phosphoribosylformylglycinamidine synthase subunit PurL [Nitrospirota bacterium]
MTADIVSRFRIPAPEMDRIRALLGRDPNLTEEAVFSALWSEHCSYKSSRIHLRKFSSKGPRVLMGPGENAGVVRVTSRTGIAFKMESHNHPSYIEPFQGAATGVGGILRDIFAMGARPVALTNSLVFGSLRQPRQMTLFRRVVAGIAAYGNSIGVPTLGGEVWFDERYAKNILVNAFALGLVAEDGIMSAVPPPKPLLAVYLGNKTGRDGVSGAAMASRSFSDGDSDLRPQVQVADPFVGKKVMEATLTIIREGLAGAIQDMGAAGLTSSSVEMASKAGLGIEIDVARVPLRDSSMEPWEILLSESQERMLLLVEESRVGRILDIARDSQVSAAVVGRIISEPVFRVKKGEAVFAEVPVPFLTDEAPLYDRPTRPHDLSPSRPAHHPPSEAGRHSIAELFHRLLDHPNGGSADWIFRQFDFEVGTRTLLPPGSDVAVVDLREENHAVAISMAGFSHPLSRDPGRGAMLLVAKCVTDLAAVGAWPVGLTDCLNFGNPERPETMSDFIAAVTGIADATKRLGIPVVSGNVSFYNETDGLSIPPTPILATCGLLSDRRNLVPGKTASPGLSLALAGTSRDLFLGGSYLDWILDEPEPEPVPQVDWETLARLQPFMSVLLAARRIRASRAIGRGGLLRSLLQIVSGGETLGVALSLPRLESPLQAFFSEAPGRILLAFEPDHERFLEQTAREFGVPFRTIGMTAPHLWNIRYQDREGRSKELSDSPEQLKKRYAASLAGQMEDLP